MDEDKDVRKVLSWQGASQGQFLNRILTLNIKGFGEGHIYFNFIVRDYKDWLNEHKNEGI